MSLPFLPDLHAEVERSWKKPCSACIHPFHNANYARVEGMCECGYELMPPVQEMLASYLSLGEALTLKAPTLPPKPLRDAFEWQSVHGSRSGRGCTAHNGCVAGLPGRSAERPGPASRAQLYCMASRWQSRELWRICDIPKYA